MNSTSLTRPFARRLLAATLAIALALPIMAQTPAASRSRAQISYTEQENPNMARLLRAIDMLSKQDRAGNLPDSGKIELANLRSEAKLLESQRKYLMNIEFPGGSLSDLLEAINTQGPVSLNVISPGSAELLKMAEIPAFGLRNASLFTLTKVIGNLVEMQRYNFQIVDDSSPNTFVAMLSRPGSIGAPNTAPAAFESVQLEEYLHSGLTIDNIVDAIKTAWELSPKNDREALKLKYHPPTKILLISGPATATNVAKNVIFSLRKKPANATP